MNFLLQAQEPKGIFLIIDDDPDEHLLLKTALDELGYKNEIVECFSAAVALDYLRDTSDEICFILADINMPQMNGLELKQQIESIPALKMKSIPFIYHSNAINKEEIEAAYNLNVQGYFQKAMNLEGTMDALRLIVCYWSNCIHPKSVGKFFIKNS